MQSTTALRGDPKYEQMEALGCVFYHPSCLAVYHLDDTPKSMESSYIPCRGMENTSNLIANTVLYEEYETNVRKIAPKRVQW